MNLESLEFEVLDGAVEAYRLYEKIIRAEYETEIGKKLYDFQMLDRHAKDKAINAARDYLKERREAGVAPGEFNWDEYHHIKDSIYEELTGEARKALTEAETAALQKYMIAKENYWNEVCGPTNSQQPKL